MGVRRVVHLESAFGKTRPPNSNAGSEHGYVSSAARKGRERKEQSRPSEMAVQVQVEERVSVDVGGERQWLGLGDNYGYGLGYARREKSDGLEEQIERELQRRGYGSGMSSSNSCGF